MTKLFKRKAQLTIGKLGEEKQLSLEGFRIYFDIEMNDKKETNTATISIYNLSEKTLGLLEQKNISISLKIGYEEEKELSTIFIGNVIGLDQDFKETDVITKITLKDGYFALSDTKLSLSFSENSNTKQIIDRIVGVLNLAKADYSSIPNYIYKQAFSCIGSPSKILDTVLARIGYEWTIVNNVLIISQKNKTNSKIPAQFLSPKTGLVNKPKRFKEKSVKTKVKDDESVDGWEIESLILPSLQPKNLIKVESSEIKGVFLIKSIRFVGDTHAAKWICAIKGIQQ